MSDADAPQPEQSKGIQIIDSAGASVNVSGTVVGRDLITYAADHATDVRGLASPYRGLAAFTYAQRELYAGRGREVARALELLTTPGMARSLLLITGASGSGKSSFAQAGLVPALEAHYAQHGARLRHAVIRPGAQPLAMLAGALAQLGIAAEGSLAAAMPFVAPTPPPEAGANDVGVIVFDQFEELFSQQCDAAQRERLSALLATLPPPAQLRLHVLVTMRADFLPELFQHPALYEQAKQGVDLRAMRPAELQEAIQRPVQHAYPQKRFETALVEALAADAAGDAAYLPLLQVTLDDLWRRGSLIRAAYGSLTDAVRRRADTVQDYSDYDDACVQPRPDEDRAAIMDIFLDLVAVSLDDDPRRDVRRRRTLAALLGTEQQQARRRHLIDDLGRARLLSASTELRDGREVEVVDLIHESLITNWGRLLQAIARRRELLQRGTRFEQALLDWEEQGRTDDYLLDGIWLAEAEELDQQGAIAVRSNAAQDLLKRSIAAREAERQRELAHAQALAEEQRQRAEEQRQANQRIRQRTYLVALVAALALLAAAIAGVLGLQSRQNAARAEAQALLAAQRARVAQARGLAVQARALQQQYPQRATLLAMEAVSTTLLSGEPAVNAAEEAFRDALAMLGGHPLVGHESAVRALALGPDGRTLVTGGDDGAARVWDLAAANPSASVKVLRGHEGAVTAIALGPDGRTLLTGSVDKTARVWDLAAVDPSASERVLHGHEGAVRALVFGPDGRTLITGGDDGTARVWDLGVADPSASTRVLRGHEGAVRALALGPGGHTLVTGSEDGTARVWDLAAADPSASERVLRGHEGAVRALALSADGRTLATGSEDGTARVWDLAAADPSASARVLRGHEGAVRALALSLDGRTLATGSDDATACVWDLTASAPSASVRALRGHRGPVNALALAPGGRALITGSDDNTARVWALDPQSLFEQACRAAGRNLSSKEWEQYLGQEPYRRTCPGLPPAAGAQAQR